MNIDVCIIYSQKKIEINYIILFFRAFKMKMQLKQRLKLLERTQKYIYIISNLFLNFFIRLT